jgi:hypothetical protein
MSAYSLSEFFVDWEYKWTQYLLRVESTCIHKLMYEYTLTEEL